MKYVIISDLHLGDGSGSDDFGDNDKKLIDFLESKSPDVIILNGDIYELWQHSLKNIKKSHSEIISYFEEKKAVLIKGNHDYTLLGKDKYVFDKDGKSYCVMHGYQNDKFMTNPFVRFGTWLVGVAEKLIPGIENIFSLSKNGSKKIHQKTLELADKMLLKYDFVVFGHTHIYGEFKDGRYLNSGDCQHSDFKCIEI